MQSVTLSVEQQNLFDYIEQSENNIFITGRAERQAKNESDIGCYVRSAQK